MSLSSDGTVMTMPVTPAYGGYGNGGMWGGEWGSWILLFLLFGMFGRGGWGNWGGNESSCCAPATCADLQRGFDNQSVMNKLNGLENGLCDGFYAQNTNILNGFHGVDNAVCQLGYQTQQGFSTLGSQIANCCCDIERSIDHANFQTAQGINSIGTQLASCCCETQRQIERGFCDTNYNLATNTTSIIQNAHNDTDRVLAKLNDMEAARQAEKIAALQAENQSLKFQASQTAQNAFISANQDAQTAELLRRLGRDCPTPAYIVPNPNCCYGNFGLTGFNGCGSCCC